jgi:hypothetical protein
MIAIKLKYDNNTIWIAFDSQYILMINSIFIRKKRTKVYKKSANYS